MVILKVTGFIFRKESRLQLKGHLVLNVYGYMDHTLHMVKARGFSMDSSTVYIPCRLLYVSCMLRTWQQNMRLSNGATHSTTGSDQIQLLQIHYTLKGRILIQF